MAAQREDAPRSKNTKASKKSNPIEEQKKALRDVRIALKEQKDATIEQRRAHEKEQKHILKEERIFSGATSRRAREDLRKLEKKAARVPINDTICEHGVNKCRICNPPATHKVQHRQTAKVEAV